MLAPAFPQGPVHKAFSPARNQSCELQKIVACLILVCRLTQAPLRELAEGMGFGMVIWTMPVHQLLIIQQRETRVTDSIPCSVRQSATISISAEPYDNTTLSIHQLGQHPTMPPSSALNVAAGVQVTRPSGYNMISVSQQRHPL